jgi:alkylation response protein AidB-like acyl-CoA dehydrogenase
VSEPSAVSAARTLADEVLFPAAGDVDRDGVIPPSHFEALAEAGLYGVAADLGVEDFCDVVEALAGGCLATAFVWIQHHRLLRSLAAGEGPQALRDAYLPGLRTGRLRSGIALAGLHPGPPRLVASRTAGGFQVTGSAPWVTGWGIIDLLHVAVRCGDHVVFGVIDATDQPGLRAARQSLVAVDASNTVELTFDGLSLPDARVTQITEYDEEAFSGGGGLRVNGSLSLGLVGRCCRLLGPSSFDDQLRESRTVLDSSSPDGMFAARAAAADLAVRAANAVVVHDGSRSILRGATGERLAREAMFLAVFGTRPRIRSALLDRLAGSADR